VRRLVVMGELILALMGFAPAPARTPPKCRFGRRQAAGLAGLEPSLWRIRSWEPFRAGERVSRVPDGAAPRETAQVPLSGDTKRLRCWRGSKQACLTQPAVSHRASLRGSRPDLLGVLGQGPEWRAGAEGGEVLLAPGHPPGSVLQLVRPAPFSTPRPTARKRPSAMAGRGFGPPPVLCVEGERGWEEERAKSAVGRVPLPSLATRPSGGLRLVREVRGLGLPPRDRSFQAPVNSWRRGAFFDALDGIHSGRNSAKMSSWALFRQENHSEPGRRGKTTPRPGRFAPSLVGLVTEAQVEASFLARDSGRVVRAEDIAFLRWRFVERKALGCVEGRLVNI